jgi:hypothetical protein
MTGGIELSEGEEEAGEVCRGGAGVDERVLEELSEARESGTAFILGS